MFELNIPPTSIADKPQRRPTRKADEAKLAGEIAALGRLILGRSTFLDTLIILTQQWVTRAEARAALADTGCGAIDAHPTRAYHYRSRIEVQLPTPATFTRLVEWLPDHIVGGLHVARDYFTATKADAEIVGHGLGHWATQNWHGNRRTDTWETTLYFAPRMSGPHRQTSRNGVLYYDKESKISGGPTTHFEARYARRTCLGRGINTAGDLLKNHNRDPVEDWLARDFKFADFSWHLVEKRVRDSGQREHDTLGHPVAVAVRALRRAICIGIDRKNPPNWAELPDRRVQECIDGHDLFHDPLVQVHVPFEAL